METDQLALTCARSVLCTPESMLSAPRSPVPQTLLAWATLARLATELIHGSVLSRMNLSRYPLPLLHFISSTTALFVSPQPISPQALGVALCPFHAYQAISCPIQIRNM